MLKHLGIIPDGNRRWAREKGIPTLEGHRRGYNKLKEVGRWCLEAGIEVISFWAFSTENWRRSEEEVSYLMDLLAFFLEKDVDELNEEGIKLKIIGRTKELSPKLQALITKAETKTANNTKALFQIMLNYGGRPEIVDTVKKLVEAGIPSEQIDEAKFTEFSYTPETPEPDLIIRTSGEQRLSGFMSWQATYSELFFINEYWPDFSKEHLEQAITEFENRKRRFGS